MVEEIIKKLAPSPHINNIKYPFVCRCDIERDTKRCGNCKYEMESATDEDSVCYLCQRNAYDNRADNWKSRNEV